MELLLSQGKVWKPSMLRNRGFGKQVVEIIDSKTSPKSTSSCVLRLESAAWRFGRSPEPSSQMLAGCPVAALWYRISCCDWGFTLLHCLIDPMFNLNILSWVMRGNFECCAAICFYPQFRAPFATLPLWNGFDCATECGWDSMQGS